MTTSFRSWCLPCFLFLLTLVGCEAEVRSREKGAGTGAAVGRGADHDKEPTRVALGEPTVVPLLDRPMPEVRATIAGLGDLTLLVDTGAEFSWIDRDYAIRHELPRAPLEAKLTDIAGVESVVAESSLVRELQVGGLRVTNFRPPLLRTLDPGVQGALGLDVLRMVTTAIDGKRRRMILSPHPDVAEALGAYYAPGAIALSYKVDWSAGWPRVSVGVDGVEGQQTFVLDTGSGPMTVTAKLAEALGLAVVGNTRFEGLSHASRLVDVYGVPKMVLESLTVRDEEAWEAGHNSLGWGVLRNTVVVFPAKRDRALLLLETKER